MQKKTILALVSLLLVIGPWIPVILAEKIASANGCRLNESQVSPCQVAGQDRGGILYNMSMMGWLGIMTFVPGVAGFVIALSIRD